MRRPRFDIERHDGLLLFARDEVGRCGGWKAKITSVDRDPYHEGLCSRTLPGAGTLVVSRGSRVISITYHLPESSEHIRDAIDDAISGHGRYRKMLE